MKVKSTGLGLRPCFILYYLCDLNTTFLPPLNTAFSTSYELLEYMLPKAMVRGWRVYWVHEFQERKREVSPCYKLAKLHLLSPFLAPPPSPS